MFKQLAHCGLHVSLPQFCLDEIHKLPTDSQQHKQAEQTAAEGEDGNEEGNRRTNLVCGFAEVTNCTSSSCSSRLSRGVGQSYTHSTSKRPSPLLMDMASHVTTRSTWRHTSQPGQTVYDAQSSLYAAGQNQWRFEKCTACASVTGQ
jgi:hypothetical protein